MVERLLAVGNPSFDRQSFASLPNLPSAALEAQEVARAYDPATSLVLTADDAKKDSVIRAMANSDVLHLASHYLVDERSPMQSQLLLAKSDARADRAPSSGSLFARDIYNMKLRRPRLAVLSACRTGVERYYNGEGMIGMARTFLAAGVPVVVASQWPVDTVSTNTLMVKLHERRRSGATTEALRLAQIEIINDFSSPYQHPYYWAPFVTIGGYATY
jgi:CHAT domain-containing protein